VARTSRYLLLYAPEVHGHLRVVDRTYLRGLRRAIEEQLSVTPDTETRNKKPLERSPGPFGATWELRCGPGNRFRVFYEVTEQRPEVWILAIGVKDHNRLYFAGKEFMP
jgi:mRNA-degrading endonuclease RelE of RelBE toxin-antitoxin system